MMYDVHGISCSAFLTWEPPQGEQGAQWWSLASQHVTAFSTTIFLVQVLRGAPGGLTSSPF